ncbi:MAG TPA: cupin domain-containing protein [Methylomirabilota bacterium]|jgi:quercetin dioxygenase-like cupin family protein|nr:cupin domain-containing protein [Methylomirabilota bacterium]
MKRMALMLAVAFGAGAVFGAIGYPTLRAQDSATPKSTTILQADAVGIDGKEVLVQLTEFAPRASSGKHFHPGHEVAYVLSGSLIREVEGQPSTPMKAGESAYIPAKVPHETKNASTTEPLKLLVFRIHEKGHPVTHRLAEPYFWQ